jgi:hypothetical protein
MLVLLYQVFQRSHGNTVRKFSSIEGSLMVFVDNIEESLHILFVGVVCRGSGNMN